MESANAEEPPTVEVDLALLSGFSFSCRPDCGLCCFTTPRLDGDDERRIRLAVPSVRLVKQDGERCLAAHPNGGACQLLEGLRCSAHAARPAPCREFPISVHVGVRLQATVVLACPGLALDPIRKFGTTAPSGSFTGFESESASVRERLNPSIEQILQQAIRRRRKVVRELTEQGRWIEESEVRERLRGRRLIPSEDEYFPEELPPAEPGLEPLPMYFDQRPGPVALAESAGGWEALELIPEGGARTVGSALPPDHRPQLERAAEELLTGYLRYWLARDGFLAAVHHDMLAVPEGNVVESVLEELHAIGSDVLARGAVRAQLRGETGARLRSTDIENGIRATDQDWLDRPTWGARL